jgi:predicted secreted protein
MRKKALMVGIVMLLLLSLPASGVAATDGNPAIELDGAEIGAAAYIDGGNLYLPLRAVGEALGYKIEWPGQDSPISLTKPGNTILIDLQNSKITANDHTYYMSGEYPDRVHSGTPAGNITYMREDFFVDNLGLTVRWDRQEQRVKLESVKENAVTVKTVTEASETETIKITLQYPQLDGLKDKAVQERLNAIFEEAALAARNEGLQNAAEIEKARASGYPTSPNKGETYFDYRLKYNQNGLLSLVFNNYQYFGGAHGLDVQSSHTFNLETGAEYKLKDLFRSEADYVSLMSGIVRNEIDEGSKEGLLVELTPFQALKADQNFYLSNNAVVVYFQEYEYFPYAAGIQQFPVDFAALQDMLAPEFGFLNAKLLEPSNTENSSIPNSLNVGETGRVVLKGNPTTGYTWHYTIEDNDIVELDSENATQDSELIGAGSTYTWNFKALKAGQTKIIFKYYRDWEGEASATADNTVEYLLGVNP